MRALAMLALILVSSAADAASIGRPIRPPIVRPLPERPRPIIWFAENWEDVICYFTAYSVSPTLPPAQQKLYLGNCPPRWELERGPPGSGIIGGIRPKP